MDRLRATTNRRFVYPSLLMAMIVAAFIAMIAFSQATADTPQPATVQLIAPQRVSVGRPINLQIVASNARNLAGFQATVVAPDTGISVVSATIDKGLRGSGRDLLQLGPMLRSNMVVMGAATCPAANCNDRNPQNAQRINAGVNGRVELGTVQYSPLQPGRYELRLENVQLVDPQGTALPFTTVKAVVDVTRD